MISVCVAHPARRCLGPRVPVFARPRSWLVRRTSTRHEQDVQRGLASTLRQVGEIPERHRAALRVALDELAAGDRPGLLTWVPAYGSSGTELVAQPDEIWCHPWADFAVRVDGSAYDSVPL